MEGLPKYKRDLVAKIKVLRTELSSLQPQSGHCRLEVSRQEVFEDFIHELYEKEEYAASYVKLCADRQKSPHSDHFLATIVKFLGENKIVEVVTDKPWEEEIPRDESCNFNIIDLGSSVPIRSIELCRIVKCCKHLETNFF